MASSALSTPEPGHGGTAVLIETILLCAGGALIVLAVLADRQWLDRHQLPHMFLTRDWQILWWATERWLLALLGLVTIWPIRPSIGRQIRQGLGRDLAIQTALILLAALLSILVSEFVLRNIFWKQVEVWAEHEEPLREPDAYLGWRNIPSRTGTETFNGKRILYHFDADGRRIASPDRPVDTGKPSIVFVGESIMVGFRLDWDDSVAGRLQAVTGLQSANLAVNGYSTDQMYMRLSAALPRFADPVAVVALFTPTLLERNLRDDRPHLDGEMRWRPAVRHWRLQRLVVSNVAPYYGAATIESGIGETRDLLAKMVETARARGAEPLILVPTFMPEAPVERDLRLRILAGLPYVFVPLDAAWRIPNDGHPDARADRAMAQAVMLELERRRPDRFVAGTTGSNF
jgi:hypothetical protein